MIAILLAYDEIVGINAAIMRRLELEWPPVIREGNLPSTVNRPSGAAYADAGLLGQAPRLAPGII